MTKVSSRLKEGGKKKALPRKITRESTCLTERRKLYGKIARQESGKLFKDNRTRLNRKDK